MSSLSARIRRYRTHLTIALLCLLFLGVFYAPKMLIVVGPGEVGVIYRLFWGGTVVDRIYGEGLYVVSPWNRMYVYSTRVQEIRQPLEVITRDGLVVQLELSIRFHPEENMVGVLHQRVGPDYVEKIVVPEVASVVRNKVGKLYAVQLYTTQEDISGEEVKAEQLPATEEQVAPPPELKRKSARSSAPAIPAAPSAASPATSPAMPPVIEESDEVVAGRSIQEIIKSAIDQVSKTYVQIDDIIIMKSIIPEFVQKAIQDKLAQKELARAQGYRIQQALREKEIKKIEAEQNELLGKSLNNPNLLKWKGIEATKNLANSPNSKVIVIGSGSSGLPLILGGDR
ncbi:MAG TPA: prohibitin family protein [Blastocatellia bacterium]|nr:prohibitin family protein [Blastocatellia bacterium]